MQVDDRLQRLTLGRAILKLGQALTPGPPANRSGTGSRGGRGEICLGQQVRGVEPPVEQAFDRVRGADAAAVVPFLHLGAQLRDQRRHEYVHAGLAQSFIRREPAENRVENGAGRFREVGMECRGLAGCVQCGIGKVEQLAQVVLDNVDHDLQTQLLILMHQRIAEPHHRLQPVHCFDRNQTGLL